MKSFDLKYFILKKIKICFLSAENKKNRVVTVMKMTLPMSYSLSLGTPVVRLILCGEKNKKQKSWSGNPVYNNIFLCVELETFVQTKVSKTAAVPEKQTVVKDPQPQEEAVVEMKKKGAVKPNGGQGVLPAIITTLLLIPLLVVISIGVFIFWRKNSMYDNKGMG